MQSLMFGANSTTHHGNCLLIFKHGGGCIMVWVCLTSAKTEFFRIKINGIELSTCEILEENLVQSALHQTLGEEFTFQLNNHLQHKAKSTLELLTKKTMNVPEWPSYSLTSICLKIYSKT
uniref:Uncharacterized protein n=1 Tax=Oncorhynchus tshawytscha TaxID=74940 RepID=A0AAZ3RHH6_ONCTS